MNRLLSVRSQFPMSNEVEAWYWDRVESIREGWRGVDATSIACVGANACNACCSMAMTEGEGQGISSLPIMTRSSSATCFQL